MTAFGAADLAAARSRIEAEAARLGVRFPAAESLARYVAEVLDESTRVNLTGAKTLGAAIDVLAVDSLPLLAAWTLARPPRRIVDLGTGNGLPGVLAALAWPAAETILVERREKKAAAVARCLERAGLGRVLVEACDGRELVARRPALGRGADLVTVRAVGELAPTTREAAPWLAPGGLLVHWKAAALDPAERRAGDAQARALRLDPRPDVEFTLPAGAGRRLVVYAAR